MICSVCHSYIINSMSAHHNFLFCENLSNKLRSDSDRTHVIDCCAAELESLRTKSNVKCGVTKVPASFG